MLGSTFLEVRVDGLDEPQLISHFLIRHRYLQLATGVLVQIFKRLTMPRISQQIADARGNLDLDSHARGALGAAIAKLGKSGVDYSEAQTVAGAKMDTKKIKKAKSVLADFSNAEGARHITKQQLKNLLKLVLANHPSVKVKEAHAGAWAETMAVRFRNLLAHVNKYCKYPSMGRKYPKWFKSLKLNGIDADVESDDADVSEDLSEDAEEEEHDDEEEEEQDEEAGETYCSFIFV